MKQISILTLNCYELPIPLFTRKIRYARLAKELAVQAPDIVCLQEVVFPYTRKLITQALEKAGYIVVPQMNGGMRLTPGGLIIASRFPITGAKFTRFAEQGSYFRLDLVERIMGKGFLTVSVTLPHAPPVTIVNTHPLCPHGAYTDITPKDTARRQIMELMTAVKNSKRTILSGDLNFIPINGLYPIVTQYFVDPLANSKLVTISPNNSNRKFFAPFLQYAGRIDYTLVSKDLAGSVSQNIAFTDTYRCSDGVSRHLSDHYGIWTTLTA